MLSGIAISFGGMVWVMVVLRLVDRHISAKTKLGWDDFLIGLAGVHCLLVHLAYNYD